MRGHLTSEKRGVRGVRKPTWQGARDRTWYGFRKWVHTRVLIGAAGARAGGFVAWAASTIAKPKVLRAAFTAGLVEVEGEETERDSPLRSEQ
jgi:hypothetical protein